MADSTQILDRLESIAELDEDELSHLGALGESMDRAARRLVGDLSAGEFDEIRDAAQRGSLTDDEHAIVRWGLEHLRAVVAATEVQGLELAPRVVAELAKLEAWALPRIAQYEAERRRASLRLAS